MVEEKEIIEIDGKKFNVIVRKSKEVFSKEKLIKLIAGYAISELKNEYS